MSTSARKSEGRRGIDRSLYKSLTRRMRVRYVDGGIMNGDVSSCGFPENSEVTEVMSADGNSELQEINLGTAYF